MWHELWTKNQKGITFALGMICFLIAGLVVLNVSPSAKNQVKVQAPVVTENAAALELNSERTAAPVAAAPQSELVLYITGAVRRPGVYRLPPESRLFRLVEVAGGLTVSADAAAVNLAAVLSDGVHIHVPEKGESAGTYGGVTYGGASGKLIDINRASAEELTSLKGIGPVLAGNIVEYRTKNGRFNSIDDLLHVKGIGRRKLEDLRNHVTIGP